MAKKTRKAKCGPETRAKRQKQEERVFLVVVDDSEEMHVALRFAALRARATGGRVALFSVIEPSDFGHWQAVDDLIEKEQRDEAEAYLRKYSDQVNELCGKMPMIYFERGTPRDALLKLLEEEPRISVLVLAAGAGAKGPGPLISAFTGKFYARLTIPMTIVPGNLTDEDIDAIT